MGILKDLVDGSLEFDKSSVVADLLECRFRALDPVDYGRRHLEKLMANQMPQETSVFPVDVMPAKVAPEGPQLAVIDSVEKTAQPITPHNLDPEDQASRLAMAHEALEGAFDEAA